MRSVYLGLNVVLIAATIALLVSLSKATASPTRSLLNVESVVAVSFLVLIAVRSRSAAHQSAANMPDSSAVHLQLHDFWALLSVAVITIALFSRTLNSPFLYDAYGHLVAASTQKWADLVHSWTTHPTGGDFFFRPLGDVSYWVDIRWAHFDPLRWNAWNLVVHTLNVFLAYALARGLAFEILPSALAALLFALHGSRPEVVAWMAARYDLLAAFFVLATLCSLIKYIERKRNVWLILMVLNAVFALLSKEAAYCLPLLPLCFLPMKTQSQRGLIWKLSGVLFAITAILFTYRYWLVGSLGGYRTETGQSTISRFSPVHFAEAVFFREWASLFFPINWSVPPSFLLSLACLLFLFLLLSVAFSAHIQRSQLVASIGFVLAASLPVQHLLLLNADLNGARVLYLPMLGVGLLFASLAQCFLRQRTRVILATVLVLFESATLTHNLSIWRDVAFLAQRTCLAIGSALSEDSRSIEVRDLPSRWNGVFFLSNGFPACVLINSGQSPNRIFTADRTTQSNVKPTRKFRWSSSSKGLVEETNPQSSGNSTAAAARK